MPKVTNEEKARNFLLKMREVDGYSAYQVGAFCFAEGSYLPSFPMISRVEGGQLPNREFTSALLAVQKVMPK